MRTKQLLLLLGLAACGDSYHHDPGPAYGELGVGVFLYQCPNSGDPFCAGGTGVGDEFPRAFALGGRINLQYDWRAAEDHIADPLPQLQSASPALLARQGDGFTALVPGYAAVLAVTGNSEVVDLVHLHIREVDALQIVPGDLPGASPLDELTLEAGATSELQAIAVDSDRVLLGGVLGHTWTSADPNIVSIVAGGDSGRVSVQGGTKGTTTLTLVHLDLTTEITITVEGDLFNPTGSTGSTGESTGDSTSDTTGDTTSDTTGETTGSDSSTGGVL